MEQTAANFWTECLSWILISIIPLKGREQYRLFAVLSLLHIVQFFSLLKWLLFWLKSSSRSHGNTVAYMSDCMIYRLVETLVTIGSADWAFYIIICVTLTLNSTAQTQACPLSKAIFTRQLNATVDFDLQWNLLQFHYFQVENDSSSATLVKNSGWISNQGRSMPLKNS